MKLNRYQVGLIISLVSMDLSISIPTQAQIIPDGSIPTPTDVRQSNKLFEIMGGTEAGINLFHSFFEFSVIDENIVRFINNNPAILNVINRVTGSSVSEIFGKIEAGGSAPNFNLFLLNPNGIVFGPHASLDLKGSFVATTANAIQFGDHGFFSASSPNDPSLLTVQPSAFFFNQVRPNSIINQSTHQIKIDSEDPVSVGLEVPNDKSLLLLGGDVTIDGGILTAPNGRVELGGLAGIGTVALNTDGNHLRLSFPDDIARADVLLTNGANANVTDRGRGSIAINAQNIEISRLSRLSSGISSTTNSSNGKAGEIIFNATGKIVIDDSRIFSNVASGTIGNSSDVFIQSESLSLINGALIITTSRGKGNTGDIVIDVRKDVKIEGQSPITGLSSQIASVLFLGGEGKSGDINIKARSLSLINAQLATSTLGEGDAGNITIIVDDLVSVEKTTQIRTAVEASGIGNGGTIDLQARFLSLTDGGNLVSSVVGTFRDRPGGIGKGGDIIVNASDSVNISGVGIDGFSSGIYSSTETGAVGVAGNVTVNTPAFRLTDGAVISTQTQNASDGGNININTNTFEVRSGGQLLTVSDSLGNAGSITVNARDNITLSGSDPTFTDRLTQFDFDPTVISNIGANSSLFAQSDGSGAAGNITINTPQFRVLEGAQVSTASITSKGGNIILQGLENLQLSNSNITTSTETGKAGSININNNQTPVNSVQISDNSSLAAQATKPEGEAGSVSVNARDLTVNNGSSISASNISGIIRGDIRLENLETLQLNNGEILATTVDGKAGNLIINQGQTPVNQIELNQGNLTVEATGIGDSGNLDLNARTLNLENNSAISASTISGVGGNITLQGLENLEVNNSNISASTETGRAGNLTVNAELIQLNNKGSLSVEATEGGTAGNLTIEAGQMSVTDGAKVSVSSPQGQAGNLTISANTLFLNRGFITAETGKSEGEGGANISLKISDLLRIENESLISATANGLANGGNIDINTPLLVVFPPVGANGSDIIAKAQQGNGGRISINAQGIFGIQERPATSGNRSNDLDASSESGSTGEIRLNRELDPNRGLVELPETVVDPNALVAQNACKRGSESEFVITGRGGLPSSLNEDFNSTATQVGLVEPAPMSAGEQRSQKTSKNQGFSASVSNTIVPAQGWVFNERGEIVLVAYDPTVTGSQRLPAKGEDCNHP